MSQAFTTSGTGSLVFEVVFQTIVLPSSATIVCSSSFGFTTFACFIPGPFFRRRASGVPAPTSHSVDAVPRGGGGGPGVGPGDGVGPGRGVARGGGGGPGGGGTRGCGITAGEERGPLVAMQ